MHMVRAGISGPEWQSAGGTDFGTPRILNTIFRGSRSRRNPPAGKDSLRLSTGAQFHFPRVDRNSPTPRAGCAPSGIRPLARIRNPSARCNVGVRPLQSARFGPDGIVVRWRASRVAQRFHRATLIAHQRLRGTDGVRKKNFFFSCAAGWMAARRQPAARKPIASASADDDDTLLQLSAASCSNVECRFAR